MSETVVLDVEMKSPIDRVWHALTNAETLSDWMMFSTSDFQPMVGHAFQFTTGSGGWSMTIDCEVTEVDEPNRLAYTWVTEGQGGQPHSTLVTWTLTSAGDGKTQLHLEQSGFRPEAKQEIGGARASWKSMLEQLRGKLEAA
ncbi:MAG TPA: SRPBCC domain-containing protein [Thermomicrobiales bacterium]|nr:SRPBCC domain-containing protein [Thermomicrobiales bacterium]